MGSKGTAATAPGTWHHWNVATPGRGRPPFTSPAPEPPPWPCEEVGCASLILQAGKLRLEEGVLFAGVTQPGRLERGSPDAWSSRCPFPRKLAETQIPKSRAGRQGRQRQVGSLTQVTATGEPRPAGGGRHSAAPLTLLNWKRSRLSLSRAGSCPGLRNRRMVLSVEPPGERGEVAGRQRQAAVQPPSTHAGSQAPVQLLSPGPAVAGPGPGPRRRPRPPSCAPLLHVPSTGEEPRDFCTCRPGAGGSSKPCSRPPWPYKASGRSWGRKPFHLAL